MKWVSVNSASNQETYHLFKNDKKILTVILNPFSNSARVECEEQKRIFFIRKEGFLRNKTVLLNEYGVRIGELGHENNEQFINLNDEKFYYNTSNNAGNELVLYKDKKENPIVSCNLLIDEGSSTIQFKKDKKLSDTSHPGLLMALCWYMFLPATKEQTIEFA